MSGTRPARRAPADIAPPPEWFTSALAAPATEGAAELAGGEVRFRTWGRPTGRPALVLVHGGAAHARWWDHVAPLLADERAVCALDLTGHGDSARRPRYSLDQWADEVWAVADAARVGPHPVLLGHSMGGFVAIRAATRHERQPSGLVVVDSPLREITPEEEAARSARAFGPLRHYASRAEAVAHFRPVPDQPRNLDFVVAHVAETSVREVDGGWTWKFDPAVFGRDGRPLGTGRRPACAAALLRAEHGMVTPDIQRTAVERLGPALRIVDIPGAGHHVMLDRPLDLVAAVRAVLAEPPFA